MTDAVVPDTAAPADVTPAAPSPVVSIWSFYDATTGVFSGAEFHGTSDERDAQLSHLGSGVCAYQGGVDYLSQRFDVATSQVVDYQPPAPASDANQTWLWDAGTKRWISTPTLSALRDARFDVMQAMRDTLEAGTFTYNNWTFQINKSNVTGAALAAFFAVQANNTSWSQSWVLLDNTTVTLTAPQMMACAQAMQVYITSLYDTCQSLRVQLDACTTAEQVAAIV